MASHVYFHIRSHKIPDLLSKLLKISQLGKKNHGESNAGIFQPVGAKLTLIFVAKVARLSANFSRARASVRMPSLRTSIFRTVP